MKYAGAAYLVWLGLRTLAAGGLAIPADPAAQAPVSGWAIYRQGLVVDLLNPKVAIFFMAFLPQFVDPALGAAGLQMVALGAIVIAMALAWEACLIFGAGALSARLRRQPAIARWINRLCGASFVGLGLSLAMERR